MTGKRIADCIPNIPALVKAYNSGLSCDEIARYVSTKIDRSISARGIHILLEANGAKLRTKSESAKLRHEKRRIKDAG